MSQITHTCHRFTLFAVVSTLAGLFQVGVLNAQEQDQPSGALLDKVVAVVNDGVVLKSELDVQIKNITDRLRETGQAMPPQDQLNEQILERLIVDRLQLQRAERMGIRISDEVLNNALQDVADRNGIPFEQLPATMAAQGLSYAVYRQDMREQMTMDQLRQIAVFRRISITERELEQCLARNAQSFGANAEFNLSYILIGVSASASADEFRAAEAKATDLYGRLNEGADFAALAITNSTSDNALEGGALGWLAGSQLPTLFVDAVREMKDGDVSEPVRSGSGFYLIRLNETRGVTGRSEIEQKQVRHILIRPNEILDDAAAKQKLEELRTRIISGDQKFADLAKLNSDDPGSGNLGGDLGWTEPGTFVPEFDEVADKLELNQVSDVFRSRFGWHILEVTGRRIYDNTVEVRRNQCGMSLRNARLGEETELWLRRLRDEAFVETKI
ncbi:MAG: peptidylprolyl isomerase [Pseudomonadota bacterium]